MSWDGELAWLRTSLAAAMHQIHLLESRAMNDSAKIARADYLAVCAEAYLSVDLDGDDSAPSLRQALEDYNKEGL